MQFAPRTQRAPQTPVAESASAPVADSGLASGTLPSRETAVADSTAAFAVQGGKPRSRVREWCGAALDWLAADPYRQRSFANLVGRVGIDLVPWLGPTKKLLDARLLIKTGDGLLQHEGRVLALIGLAEMTLDTVTLGGSALSLMNS